MSTGNICRYLALALMLLFCIPSSLAAEAWWLEDLNQIEMQKMLGKQGGFGQDDRFIQELAPSVSETERNSFGQTQADQTLLNKELLRKHLEKDEESLIERAYRIQYSDVLFSQLMSIDEFAYLDTAYDYPWIDEHVPDELLKGQDPRLRDMQAEWLRQRDSGFSENEYDIKQGVGRFGIPREKYSQPDPADRKLSEAERLLKNDPRFAKYKKMLGGEFIAEETTKDQQNQSDSAQLRQVKPQDLLRERENRQENYQEGKELEEWRLEAGFLEPSKQKSGLNRYVTKREYVERVFGEHLRQFGYDLFWSKYFQPQKNMAPSENYVIGPGDVLKVRIWGSGTSGNITGKVGPDGTVNLPKLGVVPLAGVTYGQLNTVLARYSEQYIKGSNVDAVLDKLRNLQVYVVGQVKDPGIKSLPAFSSVLTALSFGQGPLKSGSLRHVSVFRKGKLYRELDLYELIAKGNAKNDILLEDRDVVFGPYIGPTVAVMGAVVHSGIYELKSPSGSDAVLANILKLAGGALGQASAKVFLRRFQSHQDYIISDVDINSKEISSVSVINGDLVEVRYNITGLAKTVSLRGHVFNKVEINWHSGAMVSALFKDPLNLKPGAVTDFGVIRRYMPVTASYTTIRFPLSKVMSGEQDIPLEPYDKVYVLAKKDFGIRETVYISGGVWLPGKYDYEPSMSVESLIAKAGGIRQWANLSRVEISRKFNVGELLQTRHEVVDLTKQNIALKPEDSVIIPILSNAGESRRVKISGLVRYPGVYTIAEGEKLSSLVERAGGILPDAYIYGAKYTSLKAKEVQQTNLKRLADDLEIRAIQSSSLLMQTASSVEDREGARGLQASMLALINKIKNLEAEGRVVIKLASLESFKGSSFDFTLSDGDSLEIPRVPSHVIVLGSVYAPSAYVYQPDMSVADYLKKSGGPTKGANEDGIYVLKANGEVVALSQEGYFSGSLMDAKLMPGDTLVVPEDLDRVPYFRIIKDVAQVFFQIATSAGVALAAINSI